MRGELGGWVSEGLKTREGVGRGRISEGWQGGGRVAYGEHNNNDNNNNTNNNNNINNSNNKNNKKINK